MFGGMAALLLLLFAQAYGAEVRRVVDADRCGKASDQGEVVVCGNRQRNERYRLPARERPFDPSGDTDSVMRERNRWIEGGESGIQSCGPVGPGGWTGCMAREFDRQTQQSQWGSNRPKRRW